MKQKKSGTRVGGTDMLSLVNIRLASMGLLVDMEPRTKKQKRSYWLNSFFGMETKLRTYDKECL
jgi:hypothetical protein